MILVLFCGFMAVKFILYGSLGCPRFQFFHHRLIVSTGSKFFLKLGQIFNTGVVFLWITRITCEKTTDWKTSSEWKLSVCKYLRASVSLR